MSNTEKEQKLQELKFKIQTFETLDLAQALIRDLRACVTIIDVLLSNEDVMSLVLQDLENRREQLLNVYREEMQKLEQDPEQLDLEFNENHK
jgi:hypothetical protein